MAAYLFDRTDFAPDVFSDILQLVGARSALAGGFEAGGDWALRFPAPHRLKFAVVVRGSCWFRMAGMDPIRVETGDVALLSTDGGFVLASDLRLEPVDASTLFAGQRRRFVTMGDGQGCAQLGGHIALDAGNGDILASALPPLILVRASSPHSADLRWLIEKLVREQATDALPGSGVASSQIAQLMFVELLRAHFAAGGEFPVGWLKALGDPRLVRPLRLIHAEPGRAWKLRELAQAGAMSQTTFALRFRKAMGTTPLAYLVAWRMRLAERALRETAQPVAAVGRSLGYTSESAFSHAFRRVVGCAPAVYRRRRGDAGHRP